MSDAIRFLSALDPEAEQFTFQTFDDGPQKIAWHAKTIHGSYQSVVGRLQGEQKRGSGIFVTINETDGRGRKIKNIVRVRAVFVDLDGASLAPVLNCDLEPHIVVESSPGKYHAYWLVEDLPLDQFESVQRSIALRFNGDTQVNDLSRVMRLPGFLHQKGEPFETRIVQINERLPYHVSEILAEFEPVARANGHDHATYATEPATDSAELTRLILTGEKYHEPLRSLAWRHLTDGMAPDKVVLTLRGLMEASTSEKDDRWHARYNDIPRIVSTAAEKLPGAPSISHGAQVAQALTEGPDNLGIDLVFAEDIKIDLLEAGLVEGLLGVGSMSVVYGDSNVGKSFWAIDLACHIGSGMPWRGMEVTPGVVIYIAAESPKSVERRVWAWCQTHKPERCQVAVVRSTVDLREPKATTPRLIKKIEAIQQERGPIVLIVVDTLSRAMAGANENSPEDMTAFIGNCDKLRNVTGAHTMIVHHSGKEAARGSRGHSSLRAATDTEIEITPGCATVTKQRDAEKAGSYGFKLVSFELGQNLRGEVVTTCVIEPCEAEEVKREPKRKKLGSNEQIVFDALRKALAEVGETSENGIRFVSHEQLRQRARRLLPQGEEKYKTQAFERALTSLVSDQIIQHLDGRFWIEKVMFAGNQTVPL